MFQRTTQKKRFDGSVGDLSKKRGAPRSKRPRSRSSSPFVIGAFCVFVLFCVAITSNKEDGANLSSQHKTIASPKKESSFASVHPPLSAEKLYDSIPDAERLVADTMAGLPTIAGITAILQKFLFSLNRVQKILSKKKAKPPEIIQTVFDLTYRYLGPFEDAYRGIPIFDVRDDDSIFISLAAYREHLLDQTLRFAFDNAADPDKIFAGAVVQNCFGLGGGDLPCRTGVQVVGTGNNGRPLTKVSNAPPDVNGIETFCTDPKYKKYCDANQIRVLYVDENEALGPAMARYFASKLWGGETFFMQIDAHLEFAKEWDKKYVAEIKATKQYPKSVLSAYPPGFESKVNNESPGAKLCRCEFSNSDVESKIIRINAGAGYKGYPDHPHQIPFIAAGFFFTRGEFLVDVPFDPYLPWCFMGEEIALSIRAWTSGWNIYAPRVNLITHQYRPGRMGLPKFWESVQRTWHQPSMNTKIQSRLIQRIKNIVLYPDASVEIIDSTEDRIVLRDSEHYGLGTTREGTKYLEFANIDMEEKTCRPLKWCINGELD